MTWGMTGHELQRIVGLIAAALGGIAVAALATRAQQGEARAEPRIMRPHPRVRRDLPTTSASRSHCYGAFGSIGRPATLAPSVLADSAVEHYRGSFDNPAMFTPLIVSALSTLAARARGGRPALAAA